MPGMEDEPSTTFTSLPILFSRLGISMETTDGCEATPTNEQSLPTQEPVTYEERAALRKVEREQRRSGEHSEDK